MKKILFIGTSLPMLYFINKYIKKNPTYQIFIFEKLNYIGGAWYAITNKYCKNIDHGLHYIPCNNNYEIYKNEFSKLGININLINSFKCTLNNNCEKIYNFLYAKKGWSYVLYKLYNNLIKNKNITIKFNYEVKSININNNSCIINDNFKLDKVFIPSYISLDKINIFNDNILLPIQSQNNLKRGITNRNMYTYHLLIFIKTNEILYDENFHGIYKDNNDLFDRIMFITNKEKFKSDKVNLVALLRISRSHKDTFKEYDNIMMLAFNFLKEKKLLHDSSVPIDYQITEYSFDYRAKHVKDIIHSIEKKTNSLEMLDTREFCFIINKTLEF